MSAAPTTTKASPTLSNTFSTFTSSTVSEAGVGLSRICRSDANHLPEPAAASTKPGSLVVAEDVLGGRFAVDGGKLGVGPGTVCYFGPDSLSWVDLGVGHGQFVERMLSGATTEFYDDLRWTGWESEVEMVDLDKGLSLWPPPFSAEGQDLGAVNRAVVPHAELVDFYEDMARQL